jgi:hypothetical protein
MNLNSAVFTVSRVAGRPRILLEAGLRLIERRHVDDSVVLAGEDFLTYLDSTCINNVTEQVVDVAPSKRATAIPFSIATGTSQPADPTMLGRTLDCAAHCSSTARSIRAHQRT